MNIFVAAPLTSALDPETRLINASLRACIQEVIDFLESTTTATVYSAHVIEKWGAALASPSKALERDLHDLKRSELLVAILSDAFPSPGVQLEIGFALGIGLDIVVLAPKSSPVPYLTPGLASVTTAAIIEYETCGDAISGLREWLENAGRSGQSAR